MIVVDTSALVAILLAEPERDALLDIVMRQDRILVSSVSVVETRMVIHARRGERGVIALNEFLSLSLFEIVPPDLTNTDAAHAAFVAFGRSSGHSAALNFGDLYSYALAKARGLPLLFKGDDFSATDIELAFSPR